jgi:transposase
MWIIGVDYHPSFQQIAFLMEETGEYSEQRLNHSDGEAERFYRDLQRRGVQVRVGMEATGYSRWFERLLAELGFEVWIGDPAEIKAKRVKKQKTDRQDAQLLWHRHRLVQMRIRTGDVGTCTWRCVGTRALPRSAKRNQPLPLRCCSFASDKQASNTEA